MSLRGVKLWQLNERQLGLLTYPIFDRRVAAQRIVELWMLGVDELVFEGSTEIFGVRVIAKGTVGIVVKGVRNKAEVSVKIRRLDANRLSLMPEAEKLRLANSVGVGPHLLAASRNFLVWKYVEGYPIEEWGLAAPIESLRVVVRELLKQALALDQIGLVHMELARLGDHVLVTPQLNVVIFDFETASISSGKSNVTQIAQGLIVRENPLSARVREALNITREEALKILRKYKSTRRAEALAPLFSRKQNM